MKCAGSPADTPGRSLVGSGNFGINASVILMMRECGGGGCGAGSHHTCGAPARGATSSASAEVSRNRVDPGAIGVKVPMTSGLSFEDVGTSGPAPQSASSRRC